MSLFASYEIQLISGSASVGHTVLEMAAFPGFLPRLVPLPLRETRCLPVLWTGMGKEVLRVGW